MRGDINANMEVVGADNGHVGTVETIEGWNIRLARSLAPTGKRHFVSLEWVEYVDDKVHLTKAAHDAMKQWRTAA